MLINKEGGPDIRSQDFYQDFYRFHKSSGHVWYIKDVKHRFIDASSVFIARFLSSGTASVNGLLDYDVTDLSGRDVEIIHDFEALVISNKCEVNLLARNYFSDFDDVKTFILNLKSYKYSHETGVMVNVSYLADVDDRIDWFSSLVPGVTAEKESSSFLLGLGDNPLLYVTPSEWETAWLIICSCSFRCIAAYLGISVKAVENKARNVYDKLRVANREGLLYAASQKGWVNIIPERVVTSSNIIRL